MKDKTPTDANIHIYEFLKYYLALPEAPKYAVMLDGAWGIGKTHLIDKYLKDLTNNPQDFIYVSLNGLASSEQIAEAIFYQLYPVLNNKSVKLAGMLTKTAMKYARISPDLKISDISKVDTAKLYVFDDLERTEMPYQEVLGLINQLVEHDKCKVVMLANEKEIINNGGKEGKRFKEIKEKLIGKTFAVQSSLDEALDYFISKVSSKAVRSFYDQQKSMIRKIYQCADVSNLRVLQQTMWDFERFYILLKEEHLKNEPAVLLIFQIIFAFSIDYKSGRLTEEDIKEFSGSIAILLMIDNKEDRKLTQLEQTIKRYEQVASIDDEILSKVILHQIIVQGFFNQSEILAHLDEHSYFRSKEQEKPWVTLWHVYERSDEEFEKALSCTIQQIENREFRVTGEILHVFGIQLWLTRNGFMDKALSDVVNDCKIYIDDLLLQGNLEPIPFNHCIDSLSHDSWVGLGIHQSDTDEYKEIYQYMQDKRKKSQELSYSEKAEILLGEMKKNVTLFMRRINYGTEDALYYNTPILEVIPVEGFIDIVLSMPPDGRRSVFYALQGRYEGRNFDVEFENEIKWMKNVQEILLDKSKGMPRLIQFQIKEVYCKQIGTILKKYESLEKDGR